MDFSATRALFDLPEGVVYMDGNSLGPLPKSAPERIERAVRREWGELLITAWNRAGWMEMPRSLGDRIGRLIGAAPGTVVLGDTLSVKIFQALAAALDLRPGRKVILSDSGNFPSDLYVAQGLIASLGQGHELRIVPPHDLAGQITDEVAVLMVTEVDYRTGRRHDMGGLIERAHNAGALTIWDLAHSAGAFEVDLARDGADFAAGCTYKFLNAGPGGPAFIYVRPELAETVRPALSGWLGHAAPFDFDSRYRPGPGIERMRVGTPPVLQMAALDAALDIWDRVDIAAMRMRSLALGDRFIAAVETACPELTLVTPRDHRQRGSQVSFRFAEGYAAMQALIAGGVIGDFRAPDIMRFAITPLYQSDADIDAAAAALASVIANRLWDRPEFRRRSGVT